MRWDRDRPAISKTETYVPDVYYSSLSYEYRNNPNPIGRYGHIQNHENYDWRYHSHWTSHPLSIYDLLNEIYGEFYLIDPLSIFTVEDPCIRGIKIGFKAKSKIKPWREELEDYKTECLEYWINNLALT